MKKSFVTLLFMALFVSFLTLNACNSSSSSKTYNDGGEDPGILPVSSIEFDASYFGGSHTSDPEENTYYDMRKVDDDFLYIIKGFHAGDKLHFPYDNDLIFEDAGYKDGKLTIKQRFANNKLITLEFEDLVYNYSGNVTVFADMGDFNEVFGLKSIVFGGVK